jgi:hypothetical protein
MKKKNEGPIVVGSVIIEGPEDLSVGMYAERFEIKAENGGFEFYDAQELSSFVGYLQDAFEILTGERCLVRFNDAEGETSRLPCPHLGTSNCEFMCLTRCLKGFSFTKGVNQ